MKNTNSLSDLDSISIEPVDNLKKYKKIYSNTRSSCLLLEKQITKEEKKLDALLEEYNTTPDDPIPDKINMELVKWIFHVLFGKESKKKLLERELNSQRNLIGMLYNKRRQQFNAELLRQCSK